MQLETITPAGLHGIIVIAILAVWLFFKALQLWPDYDWRGRVVLVVAMFALVGAPFLNGLSALVGGIGLP